MEINGWLQAKKDNPGPSEIAIPGYGLLNLKVSYNLKKSLKIYARVNNLLNKYYVARPGLKGRAWKKLLVRSRFFLLKTESDSSKKYTFVTAAQLPKKGDFVSQSEPKKSGLKSRKKV